MNPATPQFDDLVLWVASVVGGLAVIVGGGMAIWRWLLSPIRNEIAALHSSLADICKELHPNGGSSLRDAVNVIRDRQAEIQGDVRDLRAGLGDHIHWHLDRQ